MNKSERDALLQIVRRRERVAKAAAAQRAAELLAQFEGQLASIYSANDDETFQALYAEAEAIEQELDERLAQRCRALGIPERFRPSIHASWYGRGENALATRRAELRQVAQRAAAAQERRAKTEIERASVEVQTQLLTGALESADAQAFLSTMPSVDDLMPPLTLAEIQAAERLGLPAAKDGAA